MADEDASSISSAEILTEEELKQYLKFVKLDKKNSKIPFKKNDGKQILQRLLSQKKDDTELSIQLKTLPNYDPNHIMNWFQYDREMFLVKPEKQKKQSENCNYLA